jgi:ATP phosphoribosyltransferase
MPSMSSKRPRLERTSAEPLIRIAVPKGRILKELAPRLSALGIDPDLLMASSRKLVRHDARLGISFLMLKPDDVPTYVEYGAADIGVVGRDVLLEREHDLYVPVDLGIGRCRMVVAGVSTSVSAQRPLRVATKFPNITSRHFRKRGEQVEVIYVQGSVELAPVTGLSDVIVDLVETGETLRQNGLVEIEEVCAISTVAVANQVRLKLRSDRIAPILRAMGASR